MKSTADDLNSIYRTAIELWSLGLSVIPLKPLDLTGDVSQYKRPAIGAWKEFQQRRATVEELQAWFADHPDRGLAIVTGRISGIIAVDVDNVDLRDWLLKWVPETPIRNDTRDGEHWVYRYPEDLGERTVGNKVQILLGGEKRAVDLRGDGGYIVAPGTAHPPKANPDTGLDKTHYEMMGEWRNGWPNMPAMPISFLDAICKPDASAETISVVPGVPIQQLALGTNVDQARRYLGAIPPAVQGNGGDTSTFNTVCKLVRGFDLSDGDAFALLSEWNRGVRAAVVG